MADEISIQVGKWAVGRDRLTGDTLLRFEFLDIAPLVLLVPKDEAQKIAEAIREHYSNPPPARLS